jgi:ATP:corrinoid adenosyltransferase
LFHIFCSSKEDIEVALNGLYECKEILKNGEFDVVILDESKYSSILQTI